MMTEQAVFDAKRGNWVDRFAPGFSKPWLRLMRMDRPIGFWLLFWPCAWSLTLACMERGDGFLSLWYLRSLALFFIGAVVMRGAGCVWNDITDRHIDAEVERTRSRPIPSGQVSVRGALLFLIALALAGLFVLLQFNSFTIALGFASLLPVAAYPFMKRITHWPQLVLGLALGWGALMGWSARLAAIEPPSLLLYGATIFWIIGFDTIYAHQDREDDAVIGMKSTALRFGDETRKWLWIFYSLTMLLMLAAVMLAGMEQNLGDYSWSLAALSVMLLVFGLAAGRLYWQITTLDINNGEACLARFKDNHLFGALIYLALLMMWFNQSIAVGRTYWTPWF